MAFSLLTLIITYIKNAIKVKRRTYEKRLSLQIDGANSPYFYNEERLSMGIEKGQGTYLPDRR